MEHLFRLIYVHFSLPLAWDQLEGGFSLLIFSFPTPPLLGHRNLGPQSQELTLKVLRSSSRGDSEYGRKEPLWVGAARGLVVGPAHSANPFPS